MAKKKNDAQDIQSELDKIIGEELDKNEEQAGADKNSSAADEASVPETADEVKAEEAAPETLASSGGDNKTINRAAFSEPQKSFAPEDSTEARNLQVLYELPLNVTVRLGTTEMNMRTLLQLRPGSVIELDQSADAEVDLLVNDVIVGRGDVVVVNDRFGLRIKEIVNQEERLRYL